MAVSSSAFLKIKNAAACRVAGGCCFGGPYTCRKGERSRNYSFTGMVFLLDIFYRVLKTLFLKSDLRMYYLFLRNFIRSLWSNPYPCTLYFPRRQRPVLSGPWKSEPPVILSSFELDILNMVSTCSFELFP